MSTRAERRRLQRQLAPSLGKLDKEQIDQIIKERMNAQALMDDAMPKFEMEVFQKYEKQFKDKCKAADDHYRRYYDERVKRPKTQLKKEVAGDVMTMFFWVLRDHFDFNPEDLHKLMLEFIRLEACMQERERLGCITINDMVDQMSNEGYEMAEDLKLVDEMVDAEMERFKRPLVTAGTVFDVWTANEDERLKRLICEQGRDYPEIALVLQRTEGACKARVRKLWGTSVLARVRGGAA